MSNKKNAGINLSKKAEQIERSLPKKRKEIYEKILEMDTSIQYKNFSGLLSGLKHNKLPKKITKEFQKDMNKIEALKNEAKYCREEYDRSIQEKLRNDIRKRLNPKIDLIPLGVYPKLTNCDIYPLRNSCNYGENENSKWERCEYMKYDETMSAFDEKRWKCTYTGQVD